MSAAKVFCSSARSCIGESSRVGASERFHGRVSSVAPPLRLSRVMSKALRPPLFLARRSDLRSSRTTGTERRGMVRDDCASAGGGLLTHEPDKPLTEHRVTAAQAQSVEIEQARCSALWASTNRRRPPQQGQAGQQVIHRHQRHYVIAAGVDELCPCSGSRQCPGRDEAQNH